MSEEHSDVPQAEDRQQIFDREKEFMDRLESHGHLRKLWESASDALILVDQRGEITAVNVQAGLFFGYPREEMLGQSIEVLVPPRFRLHHVEHRDEYFAHPRPRPLGSGLAVSGLRKDGGEVPVEISLIPTETPEGLFVLAVIRDVTERRLAQERLREYAEELQRSNFELQQFAYVASHDLQEPLRTVATFCEMLQRRYQGKLDADADQWLGFVVSGARRMQSLVQDLLAYSRLESRGQPMVPVASSEIAQKAVTILRSALDEAGQSIEWDDLPTIQGDASQLVQLFQNLIANAVKFRGQEPPHVHISATLQEDKWLFAVRDNGIGIDPKFHERIFEIFKRLHPSDKYPGTGIGLAVCRKVVGRHGGRIWVESALGHGGTFYFTISVQGVSEP